MVAAGIGTTKRVLRLEPRRDVMLDVGPIGDPGARRRLKFEEACRFTGEIVLAGWRAGADLVKFATNDRLVQIKAAVLAAKENTPLPVLVS